MLNENQRLGALWRGNKSWILVRHLDGLLTTLPEILSLESVDMRIWWFTVLKAVGRLSRIRSED